MKYIYLTRKSRQSPRLTAFFVVVDTFTKSCIYFHEISLKVINLIIEKSFKCMRFNDIVIADKQCVLKHKKLKLMW